jgi:hypothetical protein
VKTRTAARKFLPAALFTLLFGGISQAQTSSDFSIELERADSAQSCPDADWFRERIASHPGSSGQTGKFKVTLERSEETWRARIQSWALGEEDLPAAERVLEDRSTACTPIAKAIAVTVAILAEERASPEVAPVESPKLASPPPPPTPARKPIPAARAERDLAIWLGAGGGATLAWIAPVAPALGLDVALDSKSLRQAVRVMLTTEQHFDLPPGRVIVQAWLVSMLSCLRLTRDDTGAALCATFDAGMLSGRAEGFEGSTQSRQSYEAVGLELQPNFALTEQLRVSASLAALLPFTRESFSVTGRGVAYVPPTLNGRALVFIEAGVF